MAIKNNRIDSMELEHFDIYLTPKTVLRLCRKVYGAEEVLDLRMWGVDKRESLYPKRGQGICMRAQGWELALKLFRDNHLPATRTTIETNNLTVPQTDS